MGVGRLRVQNLDGACVAFGKLVLFLKGRAQPSHEASEDKPPKTALSTIAQRATVEPAIAGAIKIYLTSLNCVLAGHSPLWATAGAEEGTRTPILLTGLDSESSASTNFATSAGKCFKKRVSKVYGCLHSLSIGCLEYCTSKGKLFILKEGNLRHLFLGEFFMKISMKIFACTLVLCIGVGTVMARSRAEDLTPIDHGYTTILINNTKQTVSGGIHEESKRNHAAINKQRFSIPAGGTQTVGKTWFYTVNSATKADGSAPKESNPNNTAVTFTD